MKHISYSILFFVLAGMIACTKKLDQTPPSDIAVDNFFKSVNDFRQSVTGAYVKLRGYPTQVYWLNEVRSDNVDVASDGNRDFQGINDFSPNLTTTAFIINAWNNDFNGIYNANTTLDAIESKGSSILSDSLLKRFTAECRFLRAFYYFDLLKYYGKLPIVDRVMTPIEVSTVPRSEVADVYNFIVQDLEYAMNNLPSSYPAADAGRATSYAAKGLLGVVYMTKSGPTYNIGGGPGLNSNEWNKALNLFNEIIAGNKYVFAATYPSIFSYTNENNKEVLFDVQFLSNGSGAEYPSQIVPSAFWDGQGLQNYGNGYGSGSYNVTRDLMQSYRNSAGAVVDVRDTFNIRHGWPRNSNAPNVVDTTQPFLKKYIDIARRGKDRADWPVNFIVLRYTDILMMKAECILHGAPGSQTDVLTIVNQVRARAGVAPLVSVDLPALMEERRREFFGEGKRWDDLVRSGMAVTTMNAWRVKDNATGVREVVPQFVIYPIPQADILAKPGLYEQNDGYF